MTAPTDVEQAKARLRAIVENEILLHVEPHLVVADVRLLLSECERLSREVTRWESEEVHEAMKCYQDGERLKAQRDELAKALREVRPYVRMDYAPRIDAALAAREKEGA